jgi:lipopolysaccharide transport system ATP-binding protein
MSFENGHAAPATTVAPRPGPGDDVVLAVQGLSKCYHIYDKPRDRLKQALARRFKTYYKPFWALKDINFEVKRGEAVGIVGRNGSGKSTLLQIIAGTLTPTEGEVRIRGRIAALLELGSGFNPEFTGRDNVFLNGAILGIPRREMERRFDEIASFADIGDFLDQPVKHYSSGMHARLAFSVAISVDPDVLILDEILAVGDMGFQQKCVARMKKLLDSGVTLLFVSHAPDAVKSLCRKGLFLADGKTTHWGTAEDAVNKYLGHLRGANNEIAQKAQARLASQVAFKSNVAGALRYGTGHAQIQSVRILDTSGRPMQACMFGEEVIVEADIKALINLSNLDVAFLVRDAAGVDLMGSGTADEGVFFPEIPAGQTTTVRFQFRNNFRAGHYGISMTLTRLPDTVGQMGITLDHVDAIAAFAVLADPARVVHHKFYQQVRIEAKANDWEMRSTRHLEYQHIEGQKTDADAARSL